MVAYLGPREKADKGLKSLELLSKNGENNCKEIKGY